MRLTCELVVTQIGDEYVAVPLVESGHTFRGVVRLNETGAMIVNNMIKGIDSKEIVDQILSDYSNVTRDIAENAVKTVVDNLKAVNLIEE